MEPRAYWSANSGAPNPAKAGTNINAAVVRPRYSASFCDIGGVLDDGAQPIAQPLHHGAGDEDAAFAVRRLVLPSTGPCATRVVRRLFFEGHPPLVAGVHQHEAAGAVGVLHHGRACGRPGQRARLCWSPPMPAMGIVAPNSDASDLPVDVRSIRMDARQAWSAGSFKRIVSKAVIIHSRGSLMSIEHRARGGC